ncbi:hypothetical protein K458DRAFT_407435 [Lentithecium fluviatile CBS 122367]|uniref:Ankyrin n=1 Tax=Lentithecium fluviatile CBS 122367 TaxID=1168545 RepID=A0A6G1IQA5_9PLEO|nr:hypothetical protein K458DRAFT_407435 [Lentithecium fluviatile CBS 122367]
MKLLKLPPKIFQRITAAYIAKVGLYEVFGHQPIKVYVRRLSNKILQNWLVVFLERSANGLFGAKDILPALIPKTVAGCMLFRNAGCARMAEPVERLVNYANVLVFTEVTGKTSSKDQVWYTRRVAEAVANHCSMAYNLVTKASPKFLSQLEKDKDDALFLSKAVATAEVDLVSKMLDQNAPMWSATQSFTLAIQIASRSDTGILRLLLNHRQARNSKAPESLRSDIIYKSVREKCISRSGRVAIRLVEWLKKNLGHQNHRQLRGWMVASRNTLMEKTVVVKYLLDMGFLFRLASLCRRDFFLHYWLDAKIWLRLFLEQDILNVEDTYKVRYDRSQETSLLRYAVIYCCVESVEVVLEAGTKPDGLQIGDRAEYSIRLAIVGPDSKTVQLLLGFGADTEGGNDPDMCSTLDLIPQGRAFGPEGYISEILLQ